MCTLNHGCRSLRLFHSGHERETAIWEGSASSRIVARLDRVGAAQQTEACLRVVRNPDEASDAATDHFDDMATFREDGFAEMDIEGDIERTTRAESLYRRDSSHRSNVLSRICLSGTVIPSFPAKSKAFGFARATIRYSS